MMQPHMAMAQNCRTAEQHGGGQKNSPSSCYCTPTTGGLSATKTMATFHTDEGFVAAVNAASQTGQGEILDTHATPCLGGGAWKTSDTMQRENKQSPPTSISPPKVFDEVRSSEIFGHISFEQIELKW